MKKVIFYISTLILTIAIALSARAVAFSSEPKESNPSFESVRISKLNRQEEAKFTDLKQNYEKTIIPEEKPAEKSVKAKAVKAEQNPARTADNTPIFRVTDYISICDNVNCFTSRDAERGIVQYQNTFFYGHSSIAFDRLKTVYVGQNIKLIDINGRTHTFRIAERMVKEKSYLNGKGKEDGFTAGIYSANYAGNQYSAAFMTCGNGSNNDSNYRLILFAVEI